MDSFNNNQWEDSFTINDPTIYGNKKKISEINSWIKETGESTEHKPLLLTGSSGIGKTHIAKQLLEKNGYHIHYFNALDFSNKAYVQDSLKKILYCRNISFMTSKFKRSSIIIDEIEGINSYSKKHLLSVINTVKENKIKRIPIICIGSGSYFKNLNELIKLCICINFVKPTKVQLLKKAKEITAKNKLNISKKSLDYIIKISQNDFRRLAHILYFLSFENVTTDLDDNIESLCNIVLQKNIKKSELYDFTKNLLSERTSFEDSLYFFDQEKVLLPLMIHQNYINYLNFRKTVNSKNWIQILREVSDIISFSDIIGNYIYNHHYWDLCDYYAYLSCYYPSFILTKYKMKSKKNLPVIQFTSILSRNSIERVRKNQYDFLLRHIKNIDNFYDEHLIMSLSQKILYYLLSNSLTMIKEGITLLFFYNIDIKTIPSLIKFANLEKYTSVYTRKKYLNIKKIYDQIKNNKLNQKILIV
jgi:DNA polymerase III delta prime subunit